MNEVKMDKYHCQNFAVLLSWYDTVCHILQLKFNIYVN